MFLCTKCLYRTAITCMWSSWQMVEDGIAHVHQMELLKPFKPFMMLFVLHPVIALLVCFFFIFRGAANYFLTNYYEEEY